MTRYTLTILAASLALAPALAWADSLEEITYRATSACLKIEAVSIEQCSTLNTAGSSADPLSARAALRLLYKERARFMAECEASRSFTLCQYDVEARVEGGMARAMFEAR